MSRPGLAPSEIPIAVSARSGKAVYQPRRWLKDPRFLQVHPQKTLPNQLCSCKRRGMSGV